MLQVELYGWIQIVHITALRKCLGGGIQAHLRENELVQAYLDVDMEAASVKPEKMTSVEKRLYASEVAKGRDVDRRKRRAAKGASGGDF